jgi:hypothetical protein
MHLKEALEAGRIYPQQEILDSLRKVRYADDGMIDPESVDSRVRATANAVVVITSKEELKKIPLREVQSAYFELLQPYFGKPFQEMKRHAITPVDIAQDIASRDNLVRAYISSADEIFSQIQSFWETYHPVVVAHLEELHCLKSIYGGDIAPSYTTNIACSVGLYVDTIILPDPVLRARHLFQGQMKSQRFVYYLTKHALNILNYRELALADVTPPIVVISPDGSSLDSEVLSYLGAISKIDVLTHCSKMFGRVFANEEELEKFLAQFFTPQELISKLADPGLLLFDTDWSESLDQQMLRYINETMGEYWTAPHAPDQ